MKQNITPLFIAFVCLCGGVLIYVVSRPDEIFLNQCIIELIGSNPITLVRSIFQKISFSGWLIYSLPDALWMLSLTLMILFVWEFRFTWKSISWLAIALMSGISFETLQSFHLVRGTFDHMDIVFIFIGAFIPISINLLNIKSWKTQ